MNILKNLSKILSSIGMTAIIISLLIAIEIGFIFSTFSIAYILSKTNYRADIVFSILRLHLFLYKFALAMLILSLIFKMFSAKSKNNNSTYIDFTKVRRKK